MEDYITVNGKKLTKKEFEEKKAEIEKNKDLKLVEITSNVFKVRILG